MKSVPKFNVPEFATKPPAPAPLQTNDVADETVAFPDWFHRPPLLATSRPVPDHVVVPGVASVVPASPLSAAPEMSRDPRTV